MKVEILDEAERDMIDGFRFYEAQAGGLGEYFLDSLYADVDSLRLYAGIHPLVALGPLSFGGIGVSP